MLRREFLSSGTAASLLAPAPSQAAGTLREAGERAGLPIGSSSEVDFALAPEYLALLAGNCDLFAPNMSWQRMSPTPGDTMVKLDPDIRPALARGLQLTGYHLFWHQRLPGWFAGLTRAQAERAMTDHAGTIAHAFGGGTLSWNVVNEAIRPADGRSDGLRRSPLSELFGPALFDVAYHAAAATAPGILRVYNDYDMELAIPEEEARRTTLLRLLDGMLARGVPVQAVGLQCHLRTQSFGRFNATRYHRFLAELSARGLQILITELDVQDYTQGDVAGRDREVAAVYRAFLDVAVAEPRVRAVVFWGLADRYSWQNDRTHRPDGMPGRPLPFDASLRAKPALAAVLGALASAPIRARLGGQPSSR